MLRIEGLSVHGSDNGHAILRDVNLEIEQGKFVVVTGPNGGGKTTLAKAIMGIMPSSGGRIFYNDLDITDLDITGRAKLGISYGFQQPPRFKGMTVSDMLATAHGGDLALDVACGYLTKVGLCANDYLHREIDSSLSGGEVKRIEIACILARDGQLMMFDEPEAGIDLWSFSRLTETFKRLHEKSDKTILIISHQERILRIADEILLVSGGAITLQGPMQKIYPHIIQQVDMTCDCME